MIFGIGLPRTGTSSLCEAVRTLGYRCLHDGKIVERTMLANIREGLPPLHGLDYHGFFDYPIDINFGALDSYYPSSKFIYTHRPLEPWLASRENLFWLMGRSFDRDAQIALYHAHEIAVKEHFKGRGDQFLSMAITDGWEPLCSFLGKEIPMVEFPWYNKGNTFGPYGGKHEDER